MCLPNILFSLLALLFSQVGCTLKNCSGKMEVLKTAKKNWWWFGGFSGRLTGCDPNGTSASTPNECVRDLAMHSYTAWPLFGGCSFVFLFGSFKPNFYFPRFKPCPPHPKKKQSNRAAHRSLHSTGSIMRLCLTFDGYQIFWSKILRNEK